MDKHWNLIKSIGGFSGTFILGRITIQTASDIAAMSTVVAATFTSIFTVLKIYDWCYKKFSKKNDY